jgi:hypothetical protein
MLPRPFLVLRQDHQGYVAGPVAFQTQAQVLIDRGEDLFDSLDRFAINGIADVYRQPVQQFGARAGREPLGPDTLHSAILAVALLPLGDIYATEARLDVDGAGDFANGYIARYAAYDSSDQGLSWRAGARIQGSRAKADRHVRPVPAGAFDNLDNLHVQAHLIDLSIIPRVV